jgi:nucleoside-diphosphate-sugar epimerase
MERVKDELNQVVELLDDRLTDRDQGELRDLLRHREYGVAFEWLVACIAADEIALTPSLFHRIQRLGHLMHLDRDLSTILAPRLAADEPGSPENAMAPDESVDPAEDERARAEGEHEAGEADFPILPIHQPFAEEDDLDGDDLPRTVLITGACGNLGRKLRAAWEDVYDLVLLDIAAPPDDPEVLRADLSAFDDDWIVHFHNVDTVIHLAANPNEFSSWEELEGPNLDVLANVFHASALAGVERLIFASSNHAMGGYRDVGENAPITVDLPPLPDSPYGATKLMGERLGQSLAHAFDLTFIALRLGWIQHGENRPATLPDEWARAMWLSNDDLVRLFECAVEADVGERVSVVVNGMSNNCGMRWDLSLTEEVLGYVPEDDAYAEEADGR